MVLWLIPLDIPELPIAVEGKEKWLWVQPLTSNLKWYEMFRLYAFWLPKPDLPNFLFLSTLLGPKTLEKNLEGN